MRRKLNNPDMIHLRLNDKIVRGMAGYTINEKNMLFRVWAAVMIFNKMV